MRYPEDLKTGGRIGVPAPSFGAVIEPYRSQLENAVSAFEKMGYRVMPGDNCFADNGIGISNTPERCGEELMSMYLSEDTDVLISCGGGELMCEILPFMDFDALKNGKPKWYMGYSDNTNFSFLSATILDTAAIYGQNFPTFGMETWHDSLKQSFDLLKGDKRTVKGFPMWERESKKSEEEPLVGYNLTEETKYRYYTDHKDDAVKMQGRLLGGCLDILSVLCGTGFDKVKEFNKRYSSQGTLWFLEACDLNNFGIRRSLFQLKNAGWFSTATGFIIGRPLRFGEDEMGLDQYNAVTDILKDLGVPILMDADIGHLPPQIPIVTGAMGTVNASGNDMEILFDYE